VENVAAISEETASLAANTQKLMSRVARTLSESKQAGEQLAAVAQGLQEAAARFKD
jgi:methyl-accepting chemotaxis protein